jgi:hypothetical protein
MVMMTSSEFKTNGYKLVEPFGKWQVWMAFIILLFGNNVFGKIFYAGSASQSIVSAIDLNSKDIKSNSKDIKSNTTSVIDLGKKVAADIQIIIDKNCISREEVLQRLTKTEEQNKLMLQMLIRIENKVK